MISAFPSLDGWIAPPPLPAILAILMALGFKRLGDRLSRLLFPDSREPLSHAASFVLAVAITAAAVQLVLVTWRVPVQILRVASWALGAVGLVELCLIVTRRGGDAVEKAKRFFLGQQPFERAALLILAAAALGLSLMSLGPPTDADSLDYHLGVPLAWLRRGEAYPMQDWFHARLTGSGEALNMLGLAGGTDIMGAVLSAAALAALAACLVSRAPAGRDRVFILGCLIACPLVLFLLPNQKPFLLPAVANTVALLIIVDRFRTLDTHTLLAALGCTFFAMSCKYSFLLSGGVVLLITLAGAYSSRNLTAALVIAFSWYLFLLFPSHWQKFLFYGDPISPMLEVVRQDARLPLVRFAEYLRGYTMSSLPFPLGVVVPYSLGSITSVLGAGALACLPAAVNMRRSATLIVAAFCSIAMGYAAGARSAPYYLEPYFWIAIAAASAPWGIIKTLSHRIVVVQAALVVCMAGFGAISLFPGAFTSGLRSQVMKQSAHHYEVMRWLDSVLPEDAVVASTLRSHALMPRPFVAKDIMTWTDWNAASEVAATASLVKAHQINTLIADPDAAEVLTRSLGMQRTRVEAGPMRFRTATRNPWNRAPDATIAVYGARFARDTGNVTHGSFSRR